MFTADFDYHLPQDLIAQTPLPERDQSRMMVVDRQSNEIIHARFNELLQYLKAGDVLVLNETKVIPAKAWGLRGESEIEFLFLKERKKSVWEVLCKPAKKVKLGDKISFAADFEGKVIGIEAEGKRVIQFSSSDVLSKLGKIGFPPLPPYIKRSKENKGLKLLDSERYQTVFAQKQGAIAAPTAGLHFTDRILDEIKKREVIIIRIILDIGRATFQPVRTERVEEHKMLAENYSISPAAARAINEAKKESRPVVAVGSTVVRALESASKEERVQAGRHSTSLFIYPGYEFKVVDHFLTNFHLPRSTLLMMVAAFSNLELIKKAYKDAIHQKYRFYSYGDCMLIL
jgi:S-adenosylmethionine:tRNA ribosyltransferase-isomerase